MKGGFYLTIDQYLKHCMYMFILKKYYFLSYRVNPFMQYFERTSLLQQIKKLISKGFNWNEKTLLKQNLLNIKILLGII